MTDITTMTVDDYSVDLPYERDGFLSDIGGVSKAGAWIVSQLEEMIASGAYTGESVLAHEAVLDIADKLERGGISDEARKPTADILRYLSQFVLQRRVPVS